LKRGATKLSWTTLGIQMRGKQRGYKNNEQNSKLFHSKSILNIRLLRLIHTKSPQKYKIYSEIKNNS